MNPSDTERAETLDRDPELHLGRSAWMMARTGEDNERNDRIADGNLEQERGQGHAMTHAIQEQSRELQRAIEEARGSGCAPRRQFGGIERAVDAMQRLYGALAPRFDAARGA